MTEKYRQLTEAELKTLSAQLNARFAKDTDLAKAVKKHVAAHYPPAACSAILTINNEYNDEGYNRSPGALSVYDVDGNEIVPIKECSRQARLKERDFRIGEWNYENGDEPPDEITFAINGTVLPTLFVKQP